MVNDYKYEVAFSFLKEDEPLALKINDIIQARLSTFIYSKKQEEVAGTDGEETFNKVFGEEARIVVVLYRQNWGNTPWTRIEETAIRNRAYDEGYDFTVFIPLDKNPQIPRWLPKTKIWANLDRYGIEGAANIIETKVQQGGGVTRKESVEEQAARIQRQLDFEKERKLFLTSKSGVTAANSSVEHLIKTIITLINKISKETNLKFDIRQNESGNRWLDIIGNTHSLSIDWKYFYTNTLDDSHLDIKVWKGGISRQGRYYSPHHKPREILCKTFNFDFVTSETYVWISKSEKLSSSRLAEHCIKILLNHFHKKEITPSRIL